MRGGKAETGPEAHGRGALRRLSDSGRYLRSARGSLRPHADAISDHPRGWQASATLLDSVTPGRLWASLLAAAGGLVPALYPSAKEGFEPLNVLSDDRAGLGHEVTLVDVFLYALVYW